jgi:hypothetical protein
MSEFKILCPSCTAVLRSKKPIPNGKRILCPHCHKPFVAATSEAGSGNDSSLDLDFTAPAAPSASSTKKTEAAKSAEHPKKDKPPVKKGSNRAALTLVIIGLVVVAGGGGAAGMYYFMTQPDAPVAQKGKSAKSAEAKETKTAATQTKSTDTRKNEKPGKGKEPAKSDDKARNQAAKWDAPTQPVAKVAKPPEWKEFKSPKGGFAVMFPGDPHQILEREEDVIYYGAKAEAAGAEYEITFHRLKKDELKLPVKERLDAIAEPLKDAIREKKDIELSGQPALELQLLLGDKKILAFQRWVVYKEHVFHISVLGDREKLGPDQVTRFLDSFRFVADPQGEFVDIAGKTNIPEKK